MIAGRRLDPFDSRTWTLKEAAYFQNIDQACAARRDQVISNSRPEHAAYIIRLFLANAEYHVRLLSGSFPASYRNGEGEMPMYANPHVMIAAWDFLKKPGTRFDVVVENEMAVEPDRHLLVRGVQVLKEAGEIRGSLHLTKADDRTLEAMQEADFQRHWMTLDDWAYRMEPSTDGAKAVVNFGQGDGFVESLNELFDVEFVGDGEPILTL